MSSKTKKLSNFLHKNDIFGYHIPVNFNGRRNVHTTSIGGVFSMFIKIIYGMYILKQALQMINHHDDKL